MKKKYWIIFLPLLFCLFIYLFYRTEKTVVNQIAISLFSFEDFIQLQHFISSKLPLNNHIIYSLPEGLWVFCITLTSNFLFVKIGRHQISLLFVPLLFAIGLELFQLLHFTNGRFDFWDIGFSFFFWGIAAYLIKHQSNQQNILSPFTNKSLICLLSYLIVFLAHVDK